MSGEAERRPDPPGRTPGGMAWDPAPSPHLEVAGFSGPLAQLLVLARERKRDLAKLSLQDFIAQLSRTLGREAPIQQRAEWLGMASWVVLLRSRLLLAASKPAQPAVAQAEPRKAAGAALRQIQALAAWLAARPQLGQDFFPRGAPEQWAQALPGALTATEHQLDVVEFLWASIALLDDAGGTAGQPVYRPPALDLHKVSDARARILRLLAQAAQSLLLQELAPPAAGPDRADANALRRAKSGRASTFVAALELARQGEIILAQQDPFGPIAVSRAAPVGADPRRNGEPATI